MPTRYELPWADIKADVLKAIDAFNQQRPFVNCWSVGLYIFEHKKLYPSFIGATEKLCKSRVCIVIGKMGWVRYNRIHGKRSPVYIDPRMSK